MTTTSTPMYKIQIATYNKTLGNVARTVYSSSFGLFPLGRSKKLYGLGYTNQNKNNPIQYEPVTEIIVEREDLFFTIPDSQGTKNMRLKALEALNYNEESANDAMIDPGSSQEEKSKIFKIRKLCATKEISVGTFMKVHSGRIEVIEGRMENGQFLTLKNLSIEEIPDIPAEKELAKAKAEPETKAKAEPETKAKADVAK